jgi:hypothetical protein
MRLILVEKFLISIVIEGWNFSQLILYVQRLHESGPHELCSSVQQQLMQSDCSSTREHHSDVDIHLPLFKVDRDVCEWDGNRLTNESLSHERTYVRDLFL